jgi:hypothetical protein
LERVVQAEHQQTPTEQGVGTQVLERFYMGVAEGVEHRQGLEMDLAAAAVREETVQQPLVVIPLVSLLGLVVIRQLYMFR